MIGIISMLILLDQFTYYEYNIPTIFSIIGFFTMIGSAYLLTKKKERATKFQQFCKNNELLLAKITLISALIMTGIALPMQIWKNYTEQQCGLNIIMITFPIILSSLRIPYSIMKKAWALIPPDILGLTCSIILLFQFFYYK
ncbi:hypothetical protein KKG38_00175 [Patescibacteria group bacterium]|nr:hypothetical protein [Patescibacteria group bacterium]